MVAGEAAFFDAPMRLTNEGDAVAHLLFFERTANPLPDRQASPDEDARLPDELMPLTGLQSGAVDVLVSNEHLGASFVSLEPGEAAPGPLRLQQRRRGAV